MKTLQSLIDHNIDPNEGWPISEHIEMNEILGLKDPRPFYWSTPIHVAAAQMEPDFLGILFCAGANPYFTNGGVQKTAFQVYSDAKRKVLRQCRRVP